MIWQILKHEGFEGGEKIEYYKLQRHFKLLVTHSKALEAKDRDWTGLSNTRWRYLDSGG